MRLGWNKAATDGMMLSCIQTGTLRNSRPPDTLIGVVRNHATVRRWQPGQYCSVTPKNLRPPRAAPPIQSDTQALRRRMQPSNGRRNF